MQAILEPNHIYDAHNNSSSNINIEELEQRTNKFKDDFNWTEPRLFALSLFAEGRFSTAQISHATGLSVPSLRGLKQNPTFQEAIQDLQLKYSEKIQQLGLARKENRVKLIIDRLERIQQVTEERAAAANEEEAALHNIQFDPELAKAPGGTSGIVVHERKVVGTGRDMVMFSEFNIDHQTLNVEMQLQKQLAIELGQYTEKTESTQIKKLYIGIDINDI